MVHAISHRLLLTEKRFQHRAGPCVVYGEYSDVGQVYGEHSDMGQVYGEHSDMGQVYLRMIRFSSCQNNYTTALFTA